MSDLFQEHCKRSGPDHSTGNCTKSAARKAQKWIVGRRLINFSSNDYLGLANDPRLREAAREAIAEFGVGAGASRLISGTQSPHLRLEAALANWKGTPAALTRQAMSCLTHRRREVERRDIASVFAQSSR